ncbi:hypothetical protein [Microbispora bryophytorum]|uniref:Secreted protein n=1 Tax=Microbispora bryophytorum TaxID=1460882 RepID=A0A8H9LBL2_9ACTN|nr:hypothetical protein [Microbispora bryophytorum]MBD3137060.1 hypothetical protein [Microbispora bryophytorum]TQS07313.1 hypothetical protein FLX07_11565 [Microbispora bryophytorum]GGO14259.1 hypothetical protein GCM10011574_34500 [Microbispora bryophytorum]
MKRTLLGLAAAAISGLAVTVPVTLMAGPASASGDYGPDTCVEGYIWREAGPSDHVCVTSATRTRTLADNAAKASRWTPGPYGPHTCKTGYVWREAFTGDDVCVTPAARAQAKLDNGKAAERKVSAKLWITRYTVPPVDNGDGTATSTSVDDIPRLKINGDHFNHGQVRLYIRYTSGKLYWSGTVTASAHSGYVAGSFGKKTGVFDCAFGGKPANAYAQAQDVISGRWSAKVPVRVGCAVL